jgi:hypothetical protein
MNPSLKGFLIGAGILSLFVLAVLAAFYAQAGSMNHLASDRLATMTAARQCISKDGVYLYYEKICIKRDAVIE